MTYWTESVSSMQHDILFFATLKQKEQVIHPIDYYVYFGRTDRVAILHLGNKGV